VDGQEAFTTGGGASSAIGKVDVRLPGEGDPTSGPNSGPLALDARARDTAGGAGGAVDLGGMVALYPTPETPNPKPQTLNLTPETLNP